MKREPDETVSSRETLLGWVLVAVIGAWILLPTAPDPKPWDMPGPRWAEAGNLRASIKQIEAQARAQAQNALEAAGIWSSFGANLPRSLPPEVELPEIDVPKLEFNGKAYTLERTDLEGDTQIRRFRHTPSGRASASQR